MHRRNKTKTTVKPDLCVVCIHVLYRTSVDVSEVVLDVPVETDRTQREGAHVVISCHEQLMYIISELRINY